MTQPQTFALGAEVLCTDGEAGQLKRVVLDPIARAVTHLAVEPQHRVGSGRLVPVELVESTEPQIRVRCTVADFAALEEADETRLLPMASGVWGYRGDEMLALPYFGLRQEGMSMAGGGLGSPPQVSTFDRVPAGEVEVRRGDPVHATDGAIGRVQGLVIDPSDHHVTHVLLDEGHLWGKKRVAIPITSVADVADAVRLKLSKDEVRDLPEIDVVDPK